MRAKKRQEVLPSPQNNVLTIEMAALICKYLVSKFETINLLQKNEFHFFFEESCNLTFPQKKRR